jgi:TPR repeat protein
VKKILLLLLVFGFIVSSYADFEACEVAYEKKDFQNAFLECQAFANEGDAKSQGMLGSLYQYGEGVTKDYKQAFSWYTKAAEQGNADGQSGLGSMYANGQEVSEDFQQAFNWFTKATEQGNARGQNGLGVLYDYGLGVEMDYQQAFDWYTKAVNQKFVPSHRNLALMYILGKGVTKDYQQALDLLKKVENRAGGGDTVQHMLGLMYYDGLGVTKDYKEAVSWFRKAAEQGNDLAQFSLGNAFYNGVGVTKDYKQAFNWYKKAAEQGNDLAQFSLGNAFYNGVGVTKDYKQAFNWYKKAAEQGKADGQGILGHMYETGKGITKNYKEAVNWFRKAAEQGNADGQRNLGHMYENAKGVSQDYGKAIDWYKKAADQGDSLAQQYLNNLESIIKKKEEEVKKKAEEAAKEEILQAINSMEIAPGISTNRIGKWYLSDYETESETCYGSDTEEFIVLHDQVMSRYSTEYSILDDSYLSEYFNMPFNNLHFFPNNIIYIDDNQSEIVDLSFEKPMFPELHSNPGYINQNLYKCNNLNNQIDFILLESDAIEFDKLIYSAKNKCQNNKPIDCLREFVDFADVSNNNELSRAELTRFAKFVVKWLTLKGELNLSERMGSSAATMIIAPALSEFILLNYDYDNDEHIDIKEMTFDIVNFSGNSELNNKIIRGYIEALDLLSESKTNASRMFDGLF